jgi:hypothetical protein
LTIEQFFTQKSYDFLDGKALALNLEELQAIMHILQNYSADLQKLLKSASGVFLMQSNLKSKEMLLYYIGFCIIHKAVSEKFELLLNYNPSLDFKDLEYLVLKENTSIEAMRNVAKYLKLNTQDQRDTAFSLGHVEGMLDFALNFALQSDDIRKRLGAERDLAEIRKNELWNAIRQKQKLAHNYRSMLEAEKCKLIDQKSEESSILADWDPTYNEYGKVTNTPLALKTCRSYIKATESTIRSLQSTIQSTIRAPPVRGI